MGKLKVGIIREGKVPHDKRVPLTPLQCKVVKEEFPDIELVVQPSPWRAYSDDEYRQEGITLREDLSDCNLIMGIKEVPPENLLEGKRYIFFSHTIKKQPHNKALLQAVLKKKITLIDYECLVDSEDNRVIGFGRYAGIVGAYNGLMAYGKKYNLYHLHPAHESPGKNEIFEMLSDAHLPNIKIVVTGTGRVANGASETLGAMKIRKVTPYEFVNYSFREAVYTQLRSENFYEPKDHSPFSSWEYHHRPKDFRCTFSDAGSFASVTDLLIHCMFWDPAADVLFTKQRMRDPDFRISVIADVTCDLNGSIPSTTQLTTIEDKFYGYDPMTESIVEPFATNAITVMAIDNLPCELPRDSSEGFGKHLIDRVLPSLFGLDTTGLIARATIAKDGSVTDRFSYLKSWAIS